MAAVAKQTSMPLATNMCTVSFADLPESIRLGSVKIILGDHHFWGGLRASVELARICRTWGIGHVHAQQLAHGHLARRDDAPGRRRAEPDLCLRHALPLAIR